MLLSSFTTLCPDPLDKWWCASVLGQQITLLLSAAECEKSGLKLKYRGALGCSKHFIFKWVFGGKLSTPCKALIWGIWYWEETGFQCRASSPSAMLVSGGRCGSHLKSKPSCEACASLDKVRRGRLYPYLQRSAVICQSSRVTPGSFFCTLFLSCCCGGFAWS